MTGRGGRTIRVDTLARVEGEGALYIKMTGERVTDVKLRIYEPPRLFEAFLRGRHFSEAADITARICGICPIAYQMSAVHAIERAMGVRVDPAVRMLVVNVLAELGYTAHQAADARTALPLLESDLRVDLLVTDVGLPGMNGRQLAEIARQHRPGLRVLFMTGYAEQAAERQGFLEDGMDMVAKPFSVELLATKIRSMISVDE